MSITKSFSQLFFNFTLTLNKIKRTEKCLMYYQPFRQLHLNKANSLEENIEEKPKQNEIKKKIPKIKRLNFDDPKFSNTMLQMKSKKYREKTGLFYFEGKTLLKDAVFVGIKPELIFYTRKKDLDDIELSDSIKLFKVPYNDLKVWSDLSTPPGIIAICKMSECTRPYPYECSLPVTVICDQIRDPGNLGSLLRNVAGAGIKQVILTKGCVDLWDPKVLRGGSGAHFRMPILSSVDWSQIPELIDKPSTVLIARNESIESSYSKIIPYYQLNYKELSNITVIVGGENVGLSTEAYQLSKNNNGEEITIPLSNRVESLNSVAALSIILYEIKRQYSL